MLREKRTAAPREGVPLSDFRREWVSCAPLFRRCTPDASARGCPTFARMEKPLFYATMNRARANVGKLLVVGDPHIWPLNICQEIRTF